jgi:hypothetical protein
MVASRTLWISAVMLACLATALLGAASASAALVLKQGGEPAPVGTHVTGVVSFEPCGSFEATGTLTVNESTADKEKFTSTTGGGGGCAEGGPTISGFMVANKLTEGGRFIETVNLRYTTHLAEECEYQVRMLAGKFTIPGSTVAVLSGVGKRTAASPPSCAEKLHVGGVEAALYGLATETLFEAEV